MGRQADPSAVLRGHQGDVQTLVFDPSEDYIFSGDSQGEVRVWSLQDQRPCSVERLHPASAGVINLRLWHAGSATLLITQGRDGTTFVWEMQPEMKLPTEPVASFTRQAYSFCRFSLLETQLHAILAPKAAAVCPKDPAAFAAAVLAPSPPLSDAATREPTAVAAGAAAPDAVTSAIAAIHGSCSLSTTTFPAPCPALLAIPGDLERVAEVCCAACGETVAVVAQDAEAVKERPWGMCLALKLFLGPDSQVLLAVGYEAGHVAIWSLPGSGGKSVAQPVAVGQLHSEPVMALEVDNGGCRGVSGSAEDKLVSFVIDYEGGTVLPSTAIDLRKQGVADVAVSSDGKLLAAAGWDGRLRVYKRESGKALAVLKYHTEAASAVAFSPETCLIASGARDGTIALWDVYATPVR